MCLVYKVFESWCYLKHMLNKLLIFSLLKMFFTSIVCGVWCDKSQMTSVASVKQSPNSWEVSGSWYNTGPPRCCGNTGEVWSQWYRESEPVSAPACTPHATTKPNHRRAHSWLTLSLSLTPTPLYITVTFHWLSRRSVATQNLMFSLQKYSDGSPRVTCHLVMESICSESLNPVSEINWSKTQYTNVNTI